MFEGIILILLFVAGYETTDWLNSKWAMIATIGTYLIARQIWKINKLMGVTVGFTLASGIFHSFYPGSYTRLFDAAAMQVLHNHSMEAIIWIFMALMIVMAMSVRKFLAWIPLVCAASSVWLILGMLLDLDAKGPSFNRSLSATLIALMFPLVIKRVKGWKGIAVTLLPILACLVGKSSISTFALIGGMSAYFLSYKGFRRKYILNSTYFILIGTVVAYQIFGEDLFYFSGRIQEWGAIWNYFWKGDHILFGFGLGSFYPYSMEIGSMVPATFNKGVIMVTAHNDILQVLFELGIVGWILWVSVYLYTLWISRPSPMAFAFFVSLGILSFGNFPHHIGLEALVIASMYKYVLTSKFLIPLSFRSGV